MANRKNTFLIKRSNIAGKIPSAGDLLLGELGLNIADVILYASGTTANSILPIGWDRIARTGDTMTGNLFAPYLSATTVSATTYLNLPSLSGDYLPLSGGTVYGPTTYTGGLTANTLNVTGLTQTSGVTSTGGIIFPHKTLTSSYTATTADYFLNITGDTLDVFLMTAVDVEGKLLVVKNEGSGIVNVISQFGEFIDDRNDVLLTKGNSVQLVSDGVNWAILGYNISSTQANTGVIEFSGLSKVTNSTFSVARVKGFIVDDVTNPTIPFLTYVEYTGGTHTALYVSSSTETYVYLTSGGTVSQTVTPLTEQQRRQNIFLGKLGHADKTTIINAFNQPDFVLTPLSQLRDMFQPIGFVNGGIVPYVNAANLTFATSANYLYGLGINFVTDTLNPNQLYVSGNTTTTFQYRTQTGGTASNITNIDPLNYDLGGVITPLTGTKATNQRIYLVQNGVFRIQYGQTSYANFATAIAGISTETFNTFSNFRDNAILIGILTVLSTTSDLTDTSKAKFFLASKFGETVGTAGGVSTTNLQQAYNNSTSPEIVINSILDGLTIKNGTGNADNITRLLEGQTGGNGVTSFIRADGYISGTTFQSNGFIANSNGLTATTVSATTIKTPSFTANNGGITATTVSATTYYNLPTDIRVTGGTYTSGSTIFTNNTGGTFNVTGYYAPYELKNYSGATFGEKLQTAINSVPSGSTIDCNDTVGITLQINTSINVTKPVTILLGNNLVTANVGLGNNVFNILSSSVTIKGVSSSSKSTDLAGRTRITMTSGSWHIYSVGYNLLRFEDFDLIGVQSTEYRYYSGTTSLKTAPYSFNNDGSGGVFVAEGDPYVVGGGNTVSKLVLQNLFIYQTMNSGILILGGITSRIENCRVSSAAGHGIYIGSSTTTMTLINNYVSSALLAGICLDGVATSVLISNATEYAGIGLWLKSCQSVEVVGHYSEACGTRDTTRMPDNTGYFINNSLGGQYISDIGTDNLTIFKGSSYIITGGRNIYLPNPYSNNPGSPNTIGASTTTRHILVRGSVRGLYLLNPRCASSVGYGGTPRFDIGIETLSTDIPRDVNLFFNPSLDGTITPTIAGKYITQTNSSGESTVVLDQGSNTRIQSGANIWSYDTVLRTVITGTTYTTLPNDRMIVVTALTASTVVTLLTPPSGSNVIYTFSDESGLASLSEKITLSGQSSKTIDGASSFDLITTPYGYGSVYYNGTNWNVLNYISTDIRVTGGTYSDNTFTYTNNTGGTFNVLFDTLTGLTVNGNVTITGNTVVGGILGGSTIISTQSIGDEGGDIKLSTAETNNTLSGDSVTVDINQNRFRIFETGGSNRGVYIDLTSASSGIGTNLLSGGGGEINTASNLGSGTGLFAQKSGFDLQFKSLTSTGGTVTISNDSNTVNLEVIAASNFTGGTVNGATNFTNGLSANTISATTYYNLPIDVYTTGGTYSNGSLSFINNTGGTFNIITSTNYAAGVISGATYSLAGSGQINLPAIKVALYNNTNNIEPIIVYDVASGTTGVGGIPTLVDQDTNYIVVEYNGGSPRYYVYDNDGPVDDSSTVLFMIAYRATNFVHTLEFGNQGAGLANKLNDRFIMTDRFGYESGLSLSLSASTGIVMTTSGVAWNGPNRQSLTAVDSSGSTFFKNFHSGGTWTYTTTGDTVNNTYYDDGTDIVSATASKYLTNWYFRGQEINSHLYEVYGNTEYDNVALAQLAKEPSLPELITSHAILLGRIIIQVGASTGLTESAFSTVFQSTQVTSHNDLTNLQGGTAGEYYHLTSNQYNDLVLTNQTNTFTEPQIFNSGLTVTLLSANTSNIVTVSATTVTADVFIGDGSQITNITVPYGVITAMSTGNYLI